MSINSQNYFILLIIVMVSISTVIIIIFDYYKKRKQEVFNKIIDYVQGKENIILKPIDASYRGAIHTYSKVKNNGYICLTDKHLIYIPYLGKFELFLSIEKIKNVSLSKKFLSYYSPYKTLIIHTEDNQIGFIIKNIELWEKQIKELIENET